MIVIVVVVVVVVIASSWSSERDKWGQHSWGHCKFVVFVDRDLLGTPVNLRLSSQKCQGVPFSPICQNPILFAAAVRNQGPHELRGEGHNNITNYKIQGATNDEYINTTTNIIHVLSINTPIQ